MRDEPLTFVILAGDQRNLVRASSLSGAISRHLPDPNLVAVFPRAKFIIVLLDVFLRFSPENSASSAIVLA
jgi:hypothetical protein